MTDILGRSDAIRDDRCEECWKLPINFKLDHLTNSGNPQGMMSERRSHFLPSSLTADSSRDGRCTWIPLSGTSHVEYTIQCWVLSGSTIYNSCSKKVKIYECIESSPPPVCLEDYPGEYVCRQEKKLRNTLGFPGRSMYVAVNEPAPISRGANVSTSGTYIDIRVGVRGRLGQNARIPACLDIKMFWTLKTHTFISVVERDRSPTAREAHVSPFLEEVVGISQSRNLGFKLDSWEQRPEGAFAWIQTKTVQLPLLRDSYPSPTYFHPIVSRRYSLALHLKASIKGFGSASFDLVIPIQVFYMSLPTTVVHPAQSLNAVPQYFP